MKTNGKTFRGIAVAGMFLIASGGAPDYTYAASGLPAGLSLDAATGEITGTPATIAHNVISATVTDSSTNSITLDFTVDVVSRLVVKAGTPPEAETLFAYGGYDFSVVNATGAVTWAITSGALPTGLSLSGGGHLSGTATVSGTFNAVATATDAGTGDTLDIPFQLFVEIGFHFTSLNVHAYTLTVGVPFVATQNGYLNGVTPFASAIFGSWPVGLSATFDTNTHSVTYLAKKAFIRQNVQFDSVDALGNTPAFHGTSSLEAIDPNKEIIMRDGFGDVADPNPGSITIKSTDSSVTIDTSASSGTDTVYDLSTTGATGSAGGDLSGTYPNPTVAKVGGVPFNVSNGAGLIIVNDGATFNSVPVTGDVTLGGAGATLVVNINGNPLFDTSVLDGGILIGHTGLGGWNVQVMSGDATMGRTGLLTLSSSIKTGRLNRVPQIVTSGTTYTTAAGTNTIEVELFGAGGGGGGCSSAAVSGACGGGGSAGGYAKKQFAVSPSTGYTIAIGTAGTAGANTGGNGGAGGNTTFTVGGTTATAFGGPGGTGETAGTGLATIAGGAVPSASTNADVNGTGQSGGYGLRLSGLVGSSGAGGSNYFSGGGQSLVAAGAGVAGGRGCGGSGALVLNGSAAAIGGVGGGGEIIVYEYS